MSDSEGTQEIFMKTTFRIVGLTLALGAALYSPARASSPLVTCYYLCAPGGVRTTTVTYDQCCGGAPPSGNFPCPNGQQGTPYGYNSGLGPKFC